MVSSSTSVSGILQGVNAKSLNFAGKTGIVGLDFGKIITQTVTLSGSSGSQGIERKETDIHTDRNPKMKSEDTTIQKKVNKKTEKMADNESQSIDSEQVYEMLNEIREEIKEKYGVSDEELEQAMAELGITMADLLQPNNLTDLVTVITGSEDALALLTDSELSEQLKSMLDYIDQQLNGTAKDMNISAEELKAFIEEQSVQEQNNETVRKDFDISLRQAEQTQDVQINDFEEMTGSEETNEEQPEQRAEEQLTGEDLQAGKDEKVTVSEGHSNSDFSQNSKKESGSDKNVFDQITTNLTQSVQTAFDKITVENAVPIDTADIIRQIIDGAKVTVTQELSSIELQLNPENLGKVNVSVAAKDGVVTAQITAQNEAVKKAIENQLVVLKENFNNQGIKVDAVEVTIASHSFEANQNFSDNDSDQTAKTKKANKSLKLDGIGDLQEEELSENEQRIMNLLKNENSSVSYTA